jgi:hypothetical protein
MSSLLATAYALWLGMILQQLLPSSLEKLFCEPRCSLGEVFSVSPRLLFGQDGNNSLSALAGNTDMLLLMLWGSGNPGHMLLKFS